MRYANGDAYEGDWSLGRRHGEGRLQAADGRVYQGEWPSSCRKVASTLPEHSAPPASPGHLKAQAAPVHPRAKPEAFGSLPRPQEPGSGRPKV